MLKVEKLSVSYRGTPILENVGFSLKPHTMTAVLGKNGSGKSTLVSCLNQQVRYTGKISYADYNIALMNPRERAKLLAILPQVLEIPQVTVEELVMFGRNPYLDFGKRPSEEDRAAVVAGMENAGVFSFKEKMVNTLSGGERQKVYLAMVLAQQTRLLVLDEPTTYMDIENETAFLEMLTDLKKKQKKTLLVVMHNLAQAVQYADHILLLDEHQIVFDGSSSDCLESGILERVFHVEKHIFTENGKRYVVFSGASV